MATQAATELTSTGALGDGVGLWQVLAKQIRVASRAGNASPKFSPGTIIDTSQATSYYLGAAIIIAIIFIALVGTLIGMLVQCCGICCCMSKIRRVRLKKSTPCQRVCGFVWVFFLYVIFLIGAITSFAGGNLLSNSMTFIRDGTVSTLLSAQGIVYNIKPSVSYTFDQLTIVVGDSIKQTTATLNVNALNDLGVISNFNSLADSMDAVKTDVDAVRADGTAIATGKTSAVNLITTIAKTISDIDAAVTSWGPPSNGLAITGSSTTYTLKTAISTNGMTAEANSAKSNIETAPDGSKELSGLSSVPDLGTYAKDIRGIASNLTNDLQAKFNSAATEFQAKVGPALASAKDSAVSSIGSIEDQAKSSISPMIDSVNNYYNVARGYETQRSLGMITFSALLVFILLVLAIFFLFRKPSAVKGCNLISSPIYMIVQLIALILFILALVTGDVCTSLFEIKPPPIANAFDNKTATMVIQVLDIRDQCVANASLINIASNLGLVNASQFDLVALAGKQIDALPFDTITANLDLSSAGQLAKSPADQLAPVTNLDVSTISTTQLETISGTTLPALQTKLTSLSNALPATVNAALFNFNPSSASAADQNAAVSDFSGRVDSVKNSIASVNAGITKAINDINNLKKLIDKLKTDVTTTKTDSAKVTPFYNNALNGIKTWGDNAKTNVTNGIPNIKSNIKSALVVQQNILYASLNCTSLGKNVYVVQDAMCGKFLGAIDALWFSYATIGIMAFLAMPGMIYATNRILASAYRVSEESSESIEEKQQKKGKGQKNQANVRQTYPDEEDDGVPTTRRPIQINIH